MNKLDFFKKRAKQIVVGYGINQVGACCRDGSMSSFDESFSDYKEALEFENNQYDFGYGNRWYGIEEVTLYDEIESIISSREDFQRRRFDYEDELEIYIEEMKGIKTY